MFNQSILTFVGAVSSYTKIGLKIDFSWDFDILKGNQSFAMVTQQEMGSVALDSHARC